jgi:DsbC/DsbD-like thiol-disulfide interchange protein
MHKVILVLFAIAFALPFSSPAGEQKKEKKRSDSVVKIKAKLDKAPAGKAVVVLNLDIESGWHLYANPPDHEDLGDSQVVVKVAGVQAAIDYPKGKQVNDKYLGKYKSYGDKIEIRATFDRKADDNTPIEVSLYLQACTDKTPMTCLPPATVKLTVP